MFEILAIVLFLLLFGNVCKLMFKITWGLAKVVAALLLILAWPVLIGCLLFAGGVLLLVPVALIAIAWGLLSACI